MIWSVNQKLASAKHKGYYGMGSRARLREPRENCLNLQVESLPTDVLEGGDHDSESEGDVQEASGKVGESYTSTGSSDKDENFSKDSVDMQNP